MLSGENMIPRLVELYQRIDSTYADVAHRVGLTCELCDGVKCCTVDLTLHTSIEMHYLRRGFATLDPPAQGKILARCRSILEAKEQDPWGAAYRNAVCALNVDGQCILYHHRPMICRLAGIPHSIMRPDGSRVESGGCSHFQNQISDSHPEVRIDRTDFYRTMAVFETDVVKRAGKRTIPRTLSETICLEQPDIDVL